MIDINVEFGFRAYRMHDIIYEQLEGHDNIHGVIDGAKIIIHIGFINALCIMLCV